MTPRVRLYVLFLICQVMLLLATNTANAHRAYITDSLTASSSVHGVLQLKLLNGDGIIAADPVQAIIINSENYVLAATKVTDIVYIECLVSNPDIEECVVYDPLSGNVFMPNVAAFKALGPIFENDYLFYPDQAWQSGFVVRQAETIESFGFEIRNILRHFIAHLLVFIWFAFIARICISTFRSNITIWSVRLVLEKIARTIVVIFVTLLTSFYWLTQPASLLNRGVMIIGGFAVFFIVSYLVKSVRSLVPTTKV